MRMLPVLVILLAAALLIFAFPWKKSAGTRVASAAVPSNLRQATFAAGCFWGVEETFRRIKGVVSTASGYTGGHLANPTYEDVCTDLTGHAEAVLVTYDPTQVSYAELLDAFWTCHDPTTLNRQGPDAGTQYRSAIFFHDAEQEKLARASLKELQDNKIFPRMIVTALVPAAPFYLAEDYHQQFLSKNGGVCHTGLVVVHTDLAKEARGARIAATQPGIRPDAQPGAQPIAATQPSPSHEATTQPG